MNQKQLVAKYGWPERLEDDVPGEVFVFAHQSNESARAFADANNESHGYVGWVEERDGQWVSVVDIRGILDG